MRARHYFLVSAAIVSALLLGFLLARMMCRHGSPAEPRKPVASVEPLTSLTPASDLKPTEVYAHNLELRKGPNFRVYVVWISGLMARTHRQVNPSFDDPDSFILDIRKGVIHANIGDIANYLNAIGGKKAPMQHVEIQPDGNRLRIHGMVKKGIPLPVEVVGTLAPASAGHLRLHVEKISVLKVPLKGLLGTFDVHLSDLMRTTKVPGVTVSGNDIDFDTEHLLPPPHIRGQLTAVSVKVPDIEIIYGNAPNDPTQLAQWHNFIRFTGGAINFGKLTMHDADLTMIDAVNEPWFYLDLVNYEQQVMNGYTRMTAEGGLEIYMPSLDSKGLKAPASPVTLDWLRNRNTTLPADVAASPKLKKH